MLSNVKLKNPEFKSQNPVKLRKTLKNLEIILKKSLKKCRKTLKKGQKNLDKSRKTSKYREKILKTQKIQKIFTKNFEKPEKIPGKSRKNFQNHEDLATLAATPKIWKVGFYKLLPLQFFGFLRHPW